MGNQESKPKQQHKRVQSSPAKILTTAKAHRHRCIDDRQTTSKSSPKRTTFSIRSVLLVPLVHMLPWEVSMVIMEACTGSGLTSAQRGLGSRKISLMVMPATKRLNAQPRRLQPATLAMRMATFPTTAHLSGHISRDCPVDGRRSGTECYKCGKTGHIARYCQDPTTSGGPQGGGGFDNNAKGRGSEKDGLDGEQEGCKKIIGRLMSGRDGDHTSKNYWY
ncbi:hypothetical protein EJ08DRAFT_677457 [Tothia fuscella]|uniref:CCHC-type domain-containing protein n=1 Tax=Tothia fuscella TaxID=1048955 RepID=A0A9P4NVM5_9PEZI|nr:hypothetical protein EJ08DRAFT_677457 [Tothia fuscella]